MAEDVFADVRAIEDQAEQLLHEARARADQLRHETERAIAHLRREADEVFERQVQAARRDREARLADETRARTEAARTAAQRLEAIRTEQIDSLADWVIQRLLDADRGH